MPEAPSPRLGLILLDTRFPRPPGDLGRPDSYPLPVLTKVVEGAVPAEVVSDAARLDASPLAAQFVAAARDLAARGASAITTSCGFLVLLQVRLQASVPVPVLSSSLLALPELLAREAAVGVLTISAERLGGDYLRAAGVPASRMGDVWVQGMPADSHFVQAILGNLDALDESRAAQEVLAAGLALKARAPALRTLVLECTNLPPYAEALAQATGWRIVSLLQSKRLLAEQVRALDWQTVWHGPSP